MASSRRCDRSPADGCLPGATTQVIEDLSCEGGREVNSVGFRAGRGGRTPARSETRSSRLMVPVPRRRWRHLLRTTASGPSTEAGDRLDAVAAARCVAKRGLTYPVGNGRSHTVAAASATSTATPNGELKKRLISVRTCLARFTLMPRPERLVTVSLDPSPAKSADCRNGGAEPSAECRSTRRPNVN